MIKPSTWLKIRMTFYGLGFVSGLFLRVEPEVWREPFFIVIAGIGVLIVPFIFYGVIAVQVALGGTRLRTPSHAENPLQLTNPAAFLHFAANYIGACGCGVILSASWKGWPALVQGLSVSLGATGVLLAVRTAVKRHEAKARPSFSREADAAETVQRHRWSRGMLILGWVSLIAGTILVVATGWAYLHARNFVTRAQRAGGRVVELVERRGDGETRYAAVYSFLDGAGVEHNCSTQGSYTSYKVGDVVEVLFDPARPEKARINSYMELWGLATVLAVIGGVDCVLGPVFIYFGKKLKKTANKSMKADADKLGRNQESS